MKRLANKVYSNLRGAFFTQFRKSNLVLPKHSLDTNRDQLHKVVENIIIPECMNIASEVPGYPERIKKLFNYTHPVYDEGLNYSAEIIYKYMAEKEHQTEENLNKIYMLRAISDLAMTAIALFDDCTDEAHIRRGKKSWHLICEGGQNTAIYDYGQMVLCPLYILMRHFRNDPGYSLMMEYATMGNIQVMIGQVLDIMGRGKEIQSMDIYKQITYYKAGRILSTAPILGLIHAGVRSKKLIQETQDVFASMGEVVQVWDDFIDYYCTEEEKGKPSLDALNSATTWLTVKAAPYFSPSQAEEFRKCRGSSDPAKRRRIIELYDEIDAPRLYVEEMTLRHKSISEQINRLPDQRLREAAFSYLDWMIGH